MFLGVNKSSLDENCHFGCGTNGIKRKKQIDYPFMTDVRFLHKERSD